MGFSPWRYCARPSLTAIPPSPGLARRDKFQRGREVADRSVEGAQGHRALARVRQRSPCASGEARRVAARCGRELECLQIVVREHLRVVFAPGQLLDPCRRREVLGGPLGARDLAVGDVAHEQVAEGVLALAGDRARTLAADELLALELVQRSLESSGRCRPATRPRRVQKRLPITAASWSKAFCAGSSRSSRAAISPCTVSGSSLRRRPGRASMRANSSAYSGLPPARASSCALRLGRAATEPSSSWSSRAVSSSLSGESEIVSAFGLPPPQPGRRVEQLRPRGADDEQRHAARPVDEVVDEVEQVVVGPVQVLEHEHERPLARRAPRRSGARPRTPRRRRRRRPRRRRPSPTSGRRCDSTQRRPSTRRPHASFARPSAVGVVALEDAGLRLDHLAERPEGDAVAVGQAAALPPGDQVRRALDRLEELEHEPALADPRHADERDELRRALVRHAGRARPRAARPRARATDERCAPLHAVDADPRARLRRASQAGTGSALPFAVDRLAVAGSRSRARSRGRSARRRGCRSPAPRDWSRAAVLTTSPAAIPSPASGRASTVTSASPVLTPMRTSTPARPPAHSRIASAARTARSGSSSCATGAPKIAITASPMNFSTVPP